MRARESEVPKTAPKRGRPALRGGEPSVQVTVRVAESDYDWLDQWARALGGSIPELIRVGFALSENDIRLIAEYGVFWRDFKRGPKRGRRRKAADVEHYL